MSQELSDIVLLVARLMELAARTAPKARGVDNIVTRVVAGEEKERLAAKMEELAGYYGEFFARDADSVRRSDAVLLIGCRTVDLGVKTPARWPLDANVFCSLMNLGIAVGSAVKTASLLNVDNRVMYSVGVAALEMGLIEADYALGVPLSATSKSIYFDRVWPRR